MCTNKLLNIHIIYCNFYNQILFSIFIGSLHELMDSEVHCSSEENIHYSADLNARI